MAGPRAHRDVLVALGCLLSACSIPEGEYFGRVPKPDPGHFTWCSNGEPEYIDPTLATSTTDIKIAYELFDGLVTYDPDAHPLPSLATSWDISPDQKTFTFHLRDDARWSNGRPITSADFVYSLARILHPLTASNNAENVWKVRHGQQYTANTARLVLRPSGPFAAGTVVDIKSEKELPDSNLRRTSVPVVLRAAPDASAEVWARIPAGEELTVVEVGGPGCAARPKDPAACDWAYLFYGLDDGVYGWAPLAGLAAPNAERDYPVVGLDDASLRGTVKGKDLLMIPELLGLAAPDEHTLVIQTEGPTPYFLDLALTRSYRPTPREAVSRWPRQWTRPEHIVTSGPFHLTYWRERDKFDMQKSKTFWGRDRVRLDKVTFLSINEQATAANVYYQGGCDATTANNIPTSYLPVLAGETGAARQPRKDYTRAAFLGSYFYLVNVGKLTNVHFRRALSHSLDRRHLPALLKGGQIASDQYTPGTPIQTLSEADLALCGVTRDTPGVALIVEKERYCYVPPHGPGYDLALAKKELELARQEMGDKLPRHLTVRFNTGVEAHKTIAEWIQHEWEKNLGLSVDLESQEWKTFLKATVNKEYEVARMGNIGNFPDPEPEFLSIFKCKAPDNRTGYCNPEFDRLMEEAEREPDRKKRLAIAARAEDLMINEVPILPLYIYTQHTLQKPYVRGLFINLPDHQSLRETWIDPDWEGKRVSGR